MDGGEGVHEVSGVALNPGGDCQGVGGAIELPRGTKTPGVERFPRGGETSIVTPEGYGVPGGDGRGWGGDENSPATQDTKVAATDRGGGKTSGPGPVAQPRQQRDGTARASGGDEDK